MFAINIGTFINSCFEWESPQRSISAFLVGNTHTHTHFDIKVYGPRPIKVIISPFLSQFFVVVVWNFELYMVPGALLLLLTWNYFITAGRESGDTVSAVVLCSVFL